MLTPNYFTTYKSKECPWANHTLGHYTTPYSLLQGGTHTLEDISPWQIPLPGKAIKLFLCTSPTILSLRLNPALVYRSWTLATMVARVNGRTKTPIWSPIRPQITTNSVPSLLHQAFSFKKLLNLEAKDLNKIWFCHCPMYHSVQVHETLWYLAFLVIRWKEYYTTYIGLRRQNEIKYIKIPWKLYKC